MKIDFSNYDLLEFSVTDGFFCGLPAKLIIPKEIGAKFTQKNKIFRSSIWSVDGELLSASFPKFVNWGENPDNFPIPKSLSGCKLVDKIDGSTCIIDYVNSQVSMRTRGTFTYSKAENYRDFEFCLEAHPKIAEFLKEHPNVSLLCEITTPNQKIIINYGETPQFWLTGLINKEDYSLMPQRMVDDLAEELGLKRPKYYEFNSVNSLLGEIEKLRRINQNQNKVMALILLGLARQGCIEAREIVDLDDYYYESAEFIKE